MSPIVIYFLPATLSTLIVSEEVFLGSVIHRVIGSMVADFHRTLLKGGVFLYPPTDSNPKVNFDCFYEANPIAFLTEQAGGTAIDGTRRILDIEPESIHERTPLVVGGRVELADFERFVLMPKEEEEESEETEANLTEV